MAVFEAAFKKRKSGRLKWVQAQDETVNGALCKMRAYIQQHYGGQGYRLYGGPLKLKD